MSETTPSPDTAVIRRIAFALSALGSPYVVTAVTVTLVVLMLRPALSELLLWAAIGAVFAAVIPFLFVFGMCRAGRITDIHVARREQRLAPFLAALGSAAVGIVLLYTVGAPRPLIALGGVYVVLGLAFALLSLYWKMSVHTGVLTAAVLAVALVGGDNLALIALVLVPLVGWARLYRAKHSFLEALLPPVLALLITPLTYYAALALLPPAGAPPAP